MGFDSYRSADLESGRTAPMVLDMLPRKPEIDVEHLGKTNRTYLADEIAKSNAKASRSAGGKRQLLSKAKLAEQEVERRGELKKHVVRHLRATHDDGSVATDSDIPMWVDSIPGDVVDLIYVFALDAENFRKYSIAAENDEDIKDLAKK